MTPAAVLAAVGAIADRAMAQPIGAPLPSGPIFGWGRRTANPLLRESVVTAHDGGGLRVLCPAGTTFDAAEALRLELVARAPAGVAVDVQIAPAVPGALSAEHEAGVQLFGELRAERLAGCGCTSPDPGECSVCSPEHEQYCNGYACAGCNPPPRCACHVASKPLPADDEPFPWDEPEGGGS